MLRYGRTLLSEDDAHINVGASFYFLRKKSDSATKEEFEPDFFQTQGGGNIVTLWETHHVSNQGDFISGCTGNGQIVCAAAEGIPSGRGYERKESM